MTDVAVAGTFPLGDRVVKRMGYGAMQLALTWLLHRAPSTLFIPGTASLAHLRENLAAADIALSEPVLARLEAIGQDQAA
jgi:aryl-alcohol dehydrogenase-like predicted oxidoreductase